MADPIENRALWVRAQKRRINGCDRFRVVLTNLSWFEDDALTNSGDMLDPDVMAAEIVEHRRVALEQFERIQSDWKSGPGAPVSAVNEHSFISAESCSTAWEGMRPALDA